MAPHSSTLAWKIPWMEEPSRLQSMGSLRVGHNWATSLSIFTFMHWRRKWQPTPVFSPGESQGQGSLVGCRLWGRTELETTEETAAAAAALKGRKSATPHWVPAYMNVSMSSKKNTNLRSSPGSQGIWERGVISSRTMVPGKGLRRGRIPLLPGRLRQRAQVWFHHISCRTLHQETLDFCEIHTTFCTQTWSFSSVSRTFLLWYELKLILLRTIHYPSTIII